MDEQELAKEMEWIMVKHNTKKRRMNAAPTPVTQPKLQEKTAEKKEQIIKKVPTPPLVMIREVASYEE